MQDIRIAAAITCSPAGKVADNFDGMTRWVKAARQARAALVCFPEMNITGYMTSRDAFDFAETVPGPVSRRLADLAAKESITILAGMIEKDGGDRIFATHLVARPGRPVLKYRKLHIAPPEMQAYSPGTAVPVFETGGVRFGIQLCYDAHFPELSTDMALNGAQVIFMPHASPRGTPAEKYRSWMRHLPARAFDNGVFVVACNQTCENEKQMEFPGIAMVIGPSGELLKEDLSGREGLLLADLKADTLAAVRGHKMRFFLPHRRPELYGPPPVGVSAGRPAPDTGDFPAG